ncbi:hypothetical protein P2P98_08520 [Microbacterium sp. Kw_RZR3]|uniref:hypothetical protein n=1 Tax=Microbacterium sp. Kw_RZR3 TaxID=3032903 RepID=UPI0023DA9ECB|nr:hypothetical protein [Microbacterium sp. Kw_RZR3]MDF2046200.1 hypothetical protein [Microbacterium sp. Kw_RZR3]
MSKRPSRAKMCNWLSSRLYNLADISPFNPADTHQLVLNARDADSRLAALASIAGDLGWHADADLDQAWDDIQAYDARPPRPMADPDRPSMRVTPSTYSSERVSGDV